MGPENLFARVGDFDRSQRFAGGNGCDDLKRNDFTLAAEPAAHQRLNHANLRHGHFEDERQFVLEIVRDLRGRLDCQTSAIAGMWIDFKCSQTGVRLHGSVSNFVGDKAGLGYVVSVRETLIGVSEYVVIIFFEIMRLVVVNKVDLDNNLILRIEISQQKFVFNINK